MGWAKYAEDNEAISNVRLRQRHLRKINSIVHTPKEKRTTEAALNKQPTNKEACKKSTHGSFPLKPCINAPVSKFIQCKDCEIEFEFGVDEQSFFIQQGWKNPSRCLRCRKNNRERRKNQRSFLPSSKDAIKTN